jgi:hypothetical protein
MRTRYALFVSLGLAFAGVAYAADPAKPDLGSLALVPKGAIAFVHVPSLKALEADLKRFGRQTGWEIGSGDHPALDIFAHRTGIRSGVDSDGSATIAYVDPKKFRERYTVYILPVSDWDALLGSTQGEQMAADQFALTGTLGPRYVARKGRFAIVTSSIRTLDAILGEGTLAGSLRPETLALAAGPGPMVHVDMHQLTLIYEDEILSWFRAASRQVYSHSEAMPYADMLAAYMFGIADLIDQMETFDAAARFEPEGVHVDLAIRFVKGAGVANFLSGQVSGTAPVPLPANRVLTSAATLRVEPNARLDLILKSTQFFLDKAPRPQPLPEPTKEQVYEAMRVFALSLGEHMTFLSGPAAPGMGTETNVTILDLKDPALFFRGVELMVASWEALADQLNLYMRFQASPDKEDVDGVPVTLYVPRFRFGVPGRHLEFRERLRALYGPEGLVYRLAVVNNYAVIATGSDVALFRDIVKSLKENKEPEPSPAVKRLAEHFPTRQQASIVVSLPMFLGQALLRGGTPPARLGTVDPGQEVAGFTFTADGDTARLASYWPHEQVRMAMDLLKRAAPELAEAPRSLFKPQPEGPPGTPPGMPAPILAPPTPAPPLAPPTPAPPTPSGTAPGNGV